jgi:hypothetical protein
MTSRGLAAAIAATMLASRAMAQPPVPARSALSVDRAPGAEGCISREQLERAVEQRLQRPVFATLERADIVVQAHIERRATGYHTTLRMTTRDGHELGSRELDTRAAHCSALDDSLALVVALMVDIPRDEVRKRGDATPIEVPRRTYAPRRPWRMEATASGVIALGLLPGFGIGARLTAAVEPPAFWLTRLSVSGFIPAESTAEGAGGRFSVLMLGLYTCPVFLDDRPIGGKACFGQELGQYEVEGFGFADNGSATRAYYAPALQGELDFALYGGWFFRVGAGAEIPLVRDRFVGRRADDKTEIFRPWAVVLTGEAGLALRSS